MGTKRGCALVSTQILGVILISGTRSLGMILVQCEKP